MTTADNNTTSNNDKPAYRETTVEFPSPGTAIIKITVSAMQDIPGNKWTGFCWDLGHLLPGFTSEEQAMAAIQVSVCEDISNNLLFVRKEMFLQIIDRLKERSNTYLDRGKYLSSDGVVHKELEVTISVRALSTEKREPVPAENEILVCTLPTKSGD